MSAAADSEPGPSGVGKRQPRVPKQYKFTASGIPILEATDLKAKVYITQLVLSDERKLQYAAFYDPKTPSPALFDIIYDHENNPNAQKTALSFLNSLGITVCDGACPSGRFRCAWSRNKDGTSVNSGKTPAAHNFRKVLLQCYDHTVVKSKTHQTSFPYTACTSHIEILFHPPARTVLRVHGISQHNQGCLDAKVASLPCQPLASIVYQTALKLMQKGSKLQDVIDDNSARYHTAAGKGGYPNFARDSKSNHHRWILQRKDVRSLYRKLDRLKGVKVEQRPEVNVHHWLDEHSPEYKPEFAALVFHYTARLAKDEHFEISLSTPDMDTATWQYGHQNQIILDGTFGICDSRVLLFIAMVLDEERKGIPVSFLMFSAPSDNRQTSAGYDTAILVKVLSKWHEHLNAVGDGEEFTPLVAITDTDTKERAALIHVWPDIWLLICRFHLKQCFRNAQNKVKAASDSEQSVVSDLKGRLLSVKNVLLAQPDAAAAGQFLSEERQVLEHSLTTWNNGSLPSVAVSVFHYLDYLGDGYWMSFFDSWSDAARVEAARRLGCDVSEVLTTTNKLENFNNVLKNTQLARAKHSGRRLRLDVLLNEFAFFIFPRIFQQKRDRELIRRQHLAHFALLPGGPELLQKLQMRAADTVPVLAYYPEDIQQQIRGCDMAVAKQIEIPTCSANADGSIQVFDFVVHSSNALDDEVASRCYMVQIATNGASNCECPDFIRFGWACKHIRGSTALLDLLHCQNHTLKLSPQEIPFPESRQATIDLQVKLGINTRGRLHVEGFSPAVSSLTDLEEDEGEPINDETDLGDDELDTNPAAIGVDTDSNIPPDSDRDELERAHPLLKKPAISGLQLPPISIQPLPERDVSAPVPSAAQLVESQAAARLLLEARAHGNVWSIVADALDNSTAPAAFDSELLALLRPLALAFNRICAAINRREQLEAPTTSSAASGVLPAQRPTIPPSQNVHMTRWKNSYSRRLPKSDKNGTSLLVLCRLDS